MSKLTKTQALLIGAKICEIDNILLNLIDYQKELKNILSSSDFWVRKSLEGYTLEQIDIRSIKETKYSFNQINKLEKDNSIKGLTWGYDEKLKERLSKYDGLKEMVKFLKELK